MPASAEAKVCLARSHFFLIFEARWLFPLRSALFHFVCMCIIQAAKLAARNPHNAAASPPFITIRKSISAEEEEEEEEEKEEETKATEQKPSLPHPKKTTTTQMETEAWLASSQGE